MKNNNQGKLLTIVLGVILAISAGVLAYLAVSTKPPKLSEEKMQKAIKAAEAAGKENTSQTEEPEDEYEEQEPIAQSIKSFQLTAGASSVGGEQEEASEEGDEDSDEDEEDDAENSYLCAYSSDRLMTEADVQELKEGTYTDLPQGKGIIRMVVNELYAKYGYQFGKEEIQAYFNQKEWYQDIPTRSTDMNDVIKKMTDTERANVEFLSPYIEEE